MVGVCRGEGDRCLGVWLRQKRWSAEACSVSAGKSDWGRVDRSWRGGVVGDIDLRFGFMAGGCAASATFIVLRLRERFLAGNGKSWGRYICGDATAGMCMGVSGGFMRM